MDRPLQPQDRTQIEAQLVTIARAARPGVDWIANVWGDGTRQKSGSSAIRLRVFPRDRTNVLIWEFWINIVQLSQATTVEELIASIGSLNQLRQNCQRYPGADQINPTPIKYICITARIGPTPKPSLDRLLEGWTPFSDKAL